MDVETCCRYNLPIIFVIINNNGIYSGMEKEDWEECCQSARESQKESGNGTLLAVPQLASTSLLPDARYEKIIEAFDGRGFFVRKPGN